MEVVDLLGEPCENHNGTHQKVCGVRARDSLTGEELNIYSKVTVNATGPFADSIFKMHKKLNPQNTPTLDTIIPSKGVHVVLRGEFCSNGGIITTTSDNRVMFMLPWLN